MGNMLNLDIQMPFYKNILPILYLAVMGILFCFGVMDVSISERLNTYHVSDSLIGATGGVYSLGFVAGSFLAYFILKALAPIYIYRFCCSAVFLLMVGLGLCKNLYGIFFITFCEGVVACCIYVVFDSSIAPFSEQNKNRGFLNGVYLAVTYGSYALGTSSVDYLEAMPVLERFLLVASLGILVCLPLAFSSKFAQDEKLFLADKNDSLTRPASSYLKALGYLLCLPLCFMIIAIYGSFDSMFPLLLPVYAEDLGLGKGTASLVLTIYILGTAFLPPLLGYIADKVGYLRAVGIYLGIFSFGGVILFFEMGDFFLTWPTLFFMGGITSSLSAVGLTFLGLRYKGVVLALACMAMELIGQLSGAIMTFVAGESMAQWGPRGLTISLGGLCVLGLAFYCFRLFFYGKPRFLDS